jgi:dienelactone hydrolase
MLALARHLVAQQIVALVINPDAELYSYPQTLATLPAATAYLTKRPEVDPDRLAAVGYSLGGDLVVRAAGAHKQLTAIAALAPLWEATAPGLDLLREMSYPEAWRWLRDPRRAGLVDQLNALDHGSKIAPRRLLLMYGANDRLSAWNAAPDWATQGDNWVTHQIIRGVGHLDLLDHPATLNTLVRWLKEHL